MKRIGLKSGLALAFCCLAIWSCKRDRVSWDGEIVSTVDNNFADTEFGAIRNMIDAEGTADSVIFGKTTGTQGIFCPTAVTSVTVTGSNTARLTVDFGTGANCIDGRLRTGKLHADFNGRWRDAGSTVTITPEGYTVSGYAFTFTEVVTNDGRGTDGKLSWTTEVTNAVLYNATNGTIQWNGTRTTKWLEGEGSLDPQTYVYEVSGSANGTARNGLTFTASTSSPLRVELSCQWITSGIWSITPENRETRTIDYGTGGCDNQAVLSVGNYETTITLQ